MEFFFYVFTAVKIQVELGCDAVQCFGRIQVFLKSVLPPSSG